MSEVQQGGGQTGTPGRYDRSFGGLIGSMIVLVVAVLAIVVFRSVFRDTPEYTPEDIDYRELVVSVQQAGLKPVYPAQLADGWSVKDATFAAAADRPSFDLVFSTDDEHTAGVHQEDASADSLVATYVGEDATEDDGAEVTTDVGTWTGWTDTDGDHAWTTEVGDDTVLVYSSGSTGGLSDLLESLTTDKLKP